MGFTWIYIMLAAEHPKFRNHRGENISRAFFFNDSSPLRAPLDPEWCHGDCTVRQGKTTGNSYYTRKPCWRSISLEASISVF